MVLLTLGTLIANNWQTSDVPKTDTTSETTAEPTETLYPPQPVRINYLNIARCANFTSWFHVRRVAPSRAETHKRDGDDSLNIRQSDAHTWWHTDVGVSCPRHRLLNPMALPLQSDVNRSDVGSPQFLWNMATPTHTSLDLRIWGHWCVCCFHLF